MSKENIKTILKTKYKGSLSKLIKSYNKAYGKNLANTSEMYEIAQEFVILFEKFDEIEKECVEIANVHKGNVNIIDAELNEAKKEKEKLLNNKDSEDNNLEIIEVEESLHEKKKRRRREVREHNRFVDKANSIGYLYDESIKKIKNSQPSTAELYTYLYNMGSKKEISELYKTYRKINSGKYNDYVNYNPFARYISEVKKEIYIRNNALSGKKILGTKEENDKALMEAMKKSGKSKYYGDPVYRGALNNMMTRDYKEDIVENEYKVFERIERDSRSMNQFASNRALYRGIKGMTDSTETYIKKATLQAKLMFMCQIGDTRVNAGEKTDESEYKGLVSEFFSHGGRTMFILPEAKNREEVQLGDPLVPVLGDYKNPRESVVKKRTSASHSMTVKKGIYKEKKLGFLNLWDTFHNHYGVDICVGGMNKKIGSKVITDNGTSGHMYINADYNKGLNKKSALLVGIESEKPLSSFWRNVCVSFF